MKLLATAGLETWQWIAIIGAIVTAIILIISICIWASRRSKADGKKDKNTKTAQEKRAVSETAATEEKAASSKKTAEQPAQPKKPVAEEKQSAAKPADKQTVAKPAEKPAAKESGKVYHISKRRDDGKWQIKAEGATRAIKLFNTQAEAIAFAKQLAQNQEARIMIHKGDGSFRKLTY